MSHYLVIQIDDPTDTEEQLLRYDVLSREYSDYTKPEGTKEVILKYLDEATKAIADAILYDGRDRWTISTSGEKLP